MTDATNLIRIVQETQPDEIYNLAAQSPCAGLLRDAGIHRQRRRDRRACGCSRRSACSGWTARRASIRPRPRNCTARCRRFRRTRRRRSIRARPTRAAKLYAYWIVVNYREAYGLHASNGILFNHESPLRGETFVTRKITRAVAAIQLGLQDRLYLGNLDAKRDWGHAREYVRGMWLMLQQDRARRLRAGDGRGALACANSSRRPSPRPASNSSGEGKGVDERGLDAATGRVLVEIDPRYFRPTEVDLLARRSPARRARSSAGGMRSAFDDARRTKWCAKISS